MSNSLTLKQCRFTEQNKFLCIKYFYKFLQASGVRIQERGPFLISGSLLYGQGEKRLGFIFAGVCIRIGVLAGM